MSRRRAAQPCGASETEQAREVYAWASAQHAQVLPGGRGNRASLIRLARLGQALQGTRRGGHEPGAMILPFGQPERLELNRPPPKGHGAARSNRHRSAEIRCAEGGHVSGLFMSSPAPGWRRLLGLFPREQGKAHLLPDLGVVARGRLAVMVPQQRQRQRFRGGSILAVR